MSRVSRVSRVTDSASQPGPPDLPRWVVWQRRSFPDANLLLLPGPAPALVDSGFVAHAEQTLAWTRAHAPDLRLVVNTHWHSDHVGANGVLQRAGAGVAAATPEADAVNRRDPGCCVAEYLDQPVAPYTVDVPLQDGQVLRLGEADWQVIATPGHTAGHVCLWQPDERLLAVGDALSDYDVGWVNLALAGPEAAATALASQQRLADLGARMVLPAHGPVPVDAAAALTSAVNRTQKLVDDLDYAVWHGARRIFAFALMIRGGLPEPEVGPYLVARAWLADAARLLGRAPDDVAEELIAAMLAGGAIVRRDGRLHAAADHTPVSPEAMPREFPRAWRRLTDS